MLILGAVGSITVDEALGYHIRKQKPMVLASLFFYESGIVCANLLI